VPSVEELGATNSYSFGKGRIGGVLYREPFEQRSKTFRFLMALSNNILHKRELLSAFQAGGLS